ncbi:hypothetical protein [Pedobacter sp. Hv1]|uniref:hypothetical protein n=1 Tax=Pedobacter sp. Hv1 TaxID=1740090 RepID=UPI0006D88E22|nr:hypothetical protein [Pedobacter sp. Hv1]KQC01489.1 hypothetical protein AQF98_07220 [Pedobacter sp. Hv1]
MQGQVTQPPLKVYHADSFDDRLSFITKNKSYQYAEIEECDVIIHHQIVHKPRHTLKLIKVLNEKYESSQKKILIFIIHDFEYQYPMFNNIILLRTSVRASGIQPNEIVMPYIWETLRKPLPQIGSSALPKVGFCGLFSKHRKKLIRVFKESSKMHCDFILRSKFWGGAPNNKEIVSDFYKNMMDNQYILSNRGAGNYSMRFYQVLASKRIPVLVNTDMILPFADKINWTDFIIFEKDEKKCIEKVDEVHKSGKYQSMQEKCNYIFNHYFLEEVCFDHIVVQLREKSMLDVQEATSSTNRFFWWKVKKFLYKFSSN